MFTFKQTTIVSFFMFSIVSFNIHPMKQLIKEEHLRKKQEHLERLQSNLPTTIANFFEQIKKPAARCKSEYMQIYLQLSKDIDSILSYLPKPEQDILYFEMPENVDHYEQPEPTPEKLKEWFTQSIQLIIKNLIEKRRNLAENLLRFKSCNKHIVTLMDKRRYPLKSKRFKKATPSFGSSTDYFQYIH